MALVEVHDPSDPRVADFVALTDRERRRLVEGQEGGPGIFVAEGPQVVRQLLGSAYRVRSLLLTPGGLRALGDDLEAVEAPVYLAAPPVVEAVCGFHFHRGVLASADRRPLPELAAVVAAADLVLMAEAVNDNENLGALFRNAAAFGVGGLVLDRRCADPLYRRSVRVSMGQVLAVPFTRADDWPAAIEAVRATGFEVLALTPAGTAEDVAGVVRRPRQALLVGSEGSGLSEVALRAADRRVRIPMAAGVDSLNVATAAAVALHRLARPIA